MLLVGRAAKLKHRAALVKRHDHDADDGILDELLAAVGKPGQLYMACKGTGKAASSVGKELPREMEVVLSVGEINAGAMLHAYHTHACNDAPNTKEGRDCALKRGWAGPQQALALEGRNRGSQRMCNAVVCMRQAGELVGLLAMHVQPGVRTCVVQTIHAAPKVRGPWNVPSHLWDSARACVADLARAKGVKKVRFSLELPQCMSQKGAHFWISRMRWEGDDLSTKAAEAWGNGETQWTHGTYELWYQLQL